ncbi:ABC transporter permease subunit [Ferrimonas senticii]|uniref:ABC transporter permease subunit n=1 Tax=Ferrimonas senticii TaxID=394566 RepID=UPI0004189D49|nr:ABC transporter permease subunit [Ferrimonas senticii]
MANSSPLYHEEQIPSAWRQIWHHFKSRPSGYIGLWALAITLLLAVVGPLLAPFSPNDPASEILLKPPAWNAEGSIQYFFGTDALGRDIWSRVLFGAQLTYGYAALITVVTLLLGFAIGTLSGSSRGLKSSVLGHLLDALLSLPSVLLAVLIAAVIGPGFTNVFWAVGLALLPSVVRTVHNAIEEEHQKQYIIAARLDGANQYQLLRYFILPNIVDTLVVRGTLTFSAAILDVASLGFLGLGAQAPSAEWGAMVRDGLDTILGAPWTVALPGLAILFTVLATNLVGDSLRHAIAEERD